MYSLVYKDRVINGPREWNKFQFEGALEKEGIFFQVGRVAPPDEEMPIIINEDAKILKTRYEYPVYNEKIECINGPYWTFENNEVIGTFEVSEKQLEFIRSDLKQIVSNNRWLKEIKGIEVNIQGQQVKVSTKREDRDQFEILKSSGVDGVNWKFENQIWLTLSLSDIELVSNSIRTYIQQCFDWERQVSELIDSTMTAQELDEIDLGFNDLEPQPLPQ